MSKGRVSIVRKEGRNGYGKHDTNEMISSWIGQSVQNAFQVSRKEDDWSASKKLNKNNAMLKIRRV